MTHKTSQYYVLHRRTAARLHGPTAMPHGRGAGVLDQIVDVVWRFVCLWQPASGFAVGSKRTANSAHGEQRARARARLRHSSRDTHVTQTTHRHPTHTRACRIVTRRHAERRHVLRYHQAAHSPVHVQCCCACATGASTLVNLRLSTHVLVGAEARWTNALVILRRQASLPSA